MLILTVIFTFLCEKVKITVRINIITVKTESKTVRISEFWVIKSSPSARKESFLLTYYWGIIDKYAFSVVDAFSIHTMLYPLIVVHLVPGPSSIGVPLMVFPL